MYGGQLSDEKFNTYFDTQPVIDFLDRFQKRFKAGEAYLPTSADGGASAYFGSGKANVLIESTGVIGSVKSLAAGKFTPGVAYLPEGPSGRKVPTGGMGLSIIASAKPEVKAAAWEFIKHMQKPEEIAALDQASGYLTFTKSSTSAMGSFLQENPNVQGGGGPDGVVATASPRSRLYRAPWTSTTTQCCSVWRSRPIPRC